MEHSGLCAGRPCAGAHRAMMAGTAQHCTTGQEAAPLLQVLAARAELARLAAAGAAIKLRFRPPI